MTDAGELVERLRLCERILPERVIYCNPGREFLLSETLTGAIDLIERLTKTSEADVERAFALGDRVTKRKGSSWTGVVVGFYSTSLTPEGYAVESENEPGSVQIYPRAALEAMKGGA